MITPYEQAKANFEAVVTQQQADLISYAGRPSSNPKAVETRKTNLNTLVEFYSQAEQWISELEMQLLEFQLKYSRLHTDAGKLVQFCYLHNIEPNMIFQFTAEELDIMLKAKIRIQPPRVMLSELKIENDGNIGLYPQLKIIEPAADAEPAPDMAPFIDKYYNILTHPRYAQKVK